MELNGISVGYEERGPADGLPVVFIHGFPLDRTMWEPQLKALPAGLRAIAYDLRGHGESGAGDGQYSIELFVDDLLALLDSLELRRPVLCGLSMGGYIALRAAERHPDRVGGLALCDTRSEADSDEGRIKRAGQVKAIKAGGLKPFAEGFVKAVLAPQTLKDNPGAAQRLRNKIEAAPPLGVCGALLAMAARTDTTPALSAIAVPALVLVGEHDALTPPDAARSLHGKLRGSALHIVPGAAHLSNLENPEFFNGKLFDFLKNVPRA